MVLPQWTRGVTVAVALSAPLSLMALLAPAPVQAAAPGTDLRVLTPRSGETLGSTTFNLDVAFKAVAKRGVTAAEVWVDGVRWLHRELDKVKEQGVLSFAIDASSLSEGQHTVVVNILDTSGSWTSTSVNVIAGNNAGTEAGDLGGPEIQFIGVQNGKAVSSTVDITVDARAKNGKNPYVSFFINKEFKTLKNYPPYNYTWDTTTVNNGWHTIEAMGYTDDQAKAMTTRKIRVYVDNPGGNTQIQNDVPKVGGLAEVPAPRTAPSKTPPLVIPTPNDVRNVTPSPAKTGAVVAPEANRSMAPAMTTNPGSTQAPVRIAKADLPDIEMARALPGPVSAQPQYSSMLPAARSAFRSVAPGTPGSLGVRGMPSSAVSVSGMDVRTAAPAGMAAAMPVMGSTRKQEVRTAPLQHINSLPTIGGPLLVAPAMPVEKAAIATPTVAARSAAAINATVAPKTTQMAYAPVRVAPDAPVAATPVGYTRRVETVKTVPMTATTAKAAPTKVAPAKPVAVRTQSKTAPDSALQIAFDGDRIAFDVQPRVEAGLPLAPFRQIFEHTGGVVTWVPETRVVRAVNAEREIVLKDGKKDARVNDETIRMEKAMYIEGGRAIVPLSFVGKALDVDVQFDPLTGRLQINSK